MSACDCCEVQEGEYRLTDDDMECVVLCDDCADLLTRPPFDPRAARDRAAETAYPTNRGGHDHG